MPWAWLLSGSALQSKRTYRSYGDSLLLSFETAVRLYFVFPSDPTNGGGHAAGNHIANRASAGKDHRGRGLSITQGFQGRVGSARVANLLISIHVGAPAKLTCRRDGKRHAGTAVHGDIDIIPANTPSRWEMQDENDTALLLSLPKTLLHTVANSSGLDSARLEIRNRFQIRDTELEALSWAMKREMESAYPSWRLYLDGLALAVASRLVARHSSVAKQAEEQNRGLGGRRLKQVLSFIEDQLAEDLSAEQIAAVAGDKRFASQYPLPNIHGSADTSICNPTPRGSREDSADAQRAFDGRNSAGLKLRTPKPYGAANAACAGLYAAGTEAPACPIFILPLIFSADCAQSVGTCAQFAPPGIILAP